MSFWTSPTGKNLSSWFQNAGDAVAAAGDAASKRVKEITEASLDNLQRLEDRVPNLADLDGIYLTQRILILGYPGEKRGRPSRVQEMADFLNFHHGGKYMVWNFAEMNYDYTLLENQVIEYSFPGHPAPPLGLFFKITSSIDSWLQADPTNVAVIHCFTGRGRTGTIAACALAWRGEFETPTEALMEVARRRGLEVYNMTIPSQRRYVQYFTAMLDGERPRGDAVVLRRVIINGIPMMDQEKEGVRESGGCRPYLQLFKNGHLLFTSTWRDAEEKTGIRYFHSSDGSAKFIVDVPVSGDILIRCKHVNKAKQRLNIFRAAFHTGYVRESILRLTRDQLDGVDARRLPQDFFVELIFDEVGVDATGGAGAGAGGATPPRQSAGGQAAEAAAVTAPSPSVRERIQSGVLLAGREAETYERMLAEESAFWDQVDSRKQTLERRRAAEEAAEAKRQAAAEAQRQRRAEAAKQAKHAKQQAGGGGGGGSVGRESGKKVAGATASGGKSGREGAEKDAVAVKAEDAFAIDDDDDDDDVSGLRASARNKDAVARARARVRAEVERTAAARAAALQAAEEADAEGGAGGGGDYLAEMSALVSELGLGPLSGAIVDAHKQRGTGKAAETAPGEAEVAKSSDTETATAVDAVGTTEVATEAVAEAASEDASEAAAESAGSVTEVAAGEDAAEAEQEADGDGVRAEEEEGDLEALLDAEPEGAVRKDSLDFDDFDLGEFEDGEDDLSGGSDGDGGGDGAGETLDDVDDFLASLEDE